jgi:hypothetical protein
MMSVIFQAIGIGVEKMDKIGNAKTQPGQSPAQLSGTGTAGSPTSQNMQPSETMPDQEYVRLMEERYGIREEGIL